LAKINSENVWGEGGDYLLSQETDITFQKKGAKINAAAENRGGKHKSNAALIDYVGDGRKGNAYLLQQPSLLKGLPRGVGKWIQMCGRGGRQNRIGRGKKSDFAFSHRYVRGLDAMWGKKNKSR